MKRAFASFVLAALITTGGASRAADAVTLAAQQEYQDNYKRLTATIEEFQTTQAAQQKQISALSTELSRLREEIAGKNNSAATQESIRHLNEQIKKVDEARIADDRRIYEALEKLGETIKKISVASPNLRRPAAGGPAPGVSTSGGAGSGSTAAHGGPASPTEEGFEYEVVSGDQLGKIVAKYRAEKVLVSQKAIMAANPTVEWNKLRVGQKLFIPKPKP